MDDPEIHSPVAIKVKKSNPGHISLTTVALIFTFESLPENMVFPAIVNQRRGAAGGDRKRGGWSKTGRCDSLNIYLTSDNQGPGDSP